MPATVVEPEFMACNTSFIVCGTAASCHAAISQEIVSSSTLISETIHSGHHVQCSLIAGKAILRQLAAHSGLRCL